MSSKNYLDKNGLTYFWGKVKDEVESVRSMCVHVTYNSTSEQYESDKTFSEICLAYANGSNVFADLGGTRYALFSCYSYDNSSYGSITFSVSDVGNPGYGIVVGGNSISIIKDGSGESVTVGTYTNATIPEGSTSTDGNPSMDGTAYRGDSFNFARADHVHPSDTSKANTSDVLTKTNTTSYVPSANYHPATKKYVDDKGFTDLSDVFVITCTIDNLAQHVMDKTWSEIVSAYSSGKSIYCHMDGEITPYGGTYPLSYFQTSVTGEFESQGYALFALDGVKIIIWDTAFSGNSHETWEYEYTNDIYRIWVDYDSGAYHVWGHSAQSIQDRMLKGTLVVLFYDNKYYYYCGYNNNDILELYFSNYGGTTFNTFTVRDLGNTTTVIFSSQLKQSDWNENTSYNPSYIVNKPSIKAGTGDSAVIINDYYDIPCVASGDGALSEGGATKASGTLSHSEGYVTTAQGNYSHAENQLSLAYGVGSHSEGGTLSGNITISGDANATTYTIVSGCPKIYGTAGDTALYVKLYYNSEYYEPVSVTMSDGVISTITLDSTLDENNALTGASAKLFFRNVAKGKGSHAECGATYAHADYSHAEGKQTHAAGANSHTEGLVTTAASANQHVQGKYNIVDSAGTYAHIVGNGTSSSAQSNAHTLDWNGNGWYAGKLTVGAAPTNTLDVATKGYVDSKELSDLSDVFIIECTTENNTPVVDKTWTEITTAYNAGKMIYAKWRDRFFLLGGLHSSSVDSQGYAYFYFPDAMFDPNLSPYYGGQWNFYDACIAIWDTTWSGQDGETTAWGYWELPYKVPVTTYYTSPSDSDSFVLQQINNDAGNSIFMERYDQNGSSTFGMGSSGVNITSTLGVRIQNLVTPTNDTDAATKQYVDSATSGITTNLSGLTDTTISSPANGQVLSYDSTSSKWVNADTPAIKSGTGENSIIVGTIEDDSNAATYTLYLTGAANSRTYSYTTQDTLPSSIRVGSYVEYTNQYTTYTNSIESIDTTNHSITLMDTFYDALSNAEVKVYYRYANTAKGNYSLAEGRWTRATQSYSHAEGSSTLAGYGAHSEGSQTSARGMWSHSEGNYTSSRGQSSHSEGYGTIAGSDCQHVQGKYNIEDTSDVYAHIVGNGTANSRSNAHTLDWSGNSWYAGKVSAGTVASPASVTNANDLTTKAYVDNALSGVTTNLAGLTDTTVSSPSNGQILIYNSTTSKWENATSPYQTQAQVNALIAAALAEYGDGDTATYGYTDGNEVNY